MTAMIVVAGEALIDRIVSSDGAASEAPGGGPFNTARTIARLGVPAAFLGCLSTDRAGSVLRRALADDGVDLSLAMSTDAPTTRAVALLDAGRTATYRFETDDTSAPELSPETVRAAVAREPAAFHLGSLGLVLAPMVVALAEGLDTLGPGTLVMLDPNCREPAIRDRATYTGRLRRTMRRADVVKASRDDLDFLWPGAPAADAADEILAAGAAVVIVTDGPNPVECVTRGWTMAFAVPDTEIADTVGAGDALGGAFLARWIERGLGRGELTDRAAMRDAIELAIEVASVTCRRVGAHPPRRNEIAWPAP
jgi:fructokinase